jgi:hypothetical protein
VQSHSCCRPSPCPLITASVRSEVNETVNFPGAKLTRIELVKPHSWLYFELTELASNDWTLEVEPRWSGTGWRVLKALL